MNTAINPKIVTQREFVDTFFKTGKNPDGNKMTTIIIGDEPGSSYNLYLLRKRNEYLMLSKQLQQKKLIEQQTSLQHKSADENSSSNSTPKHYIWRTTGDASVRSEHAQKEGETFDWNSGTKPGDDYNCRCYAEFIDEDGNSNGKYGHGDDDNLDQPPEASSEKIDEDDEKNKNNDKGNKNGNKDNNDNNDKKEDEHMQSEKPQPDFEKALEKSKEIAKENLAKGHEFGNRECAKKVREALEAGGVALEKTGYAKNYGPSLEKAGFEPVSSRDSKNNYEPQLGDVAVLQPHSSQKPVDKTGEQPGHMAMYDGENWYSDFRQNNDWYSSRPAKNEDPDYVIYRFEE